MTEQILVSDNNNYTNNHNYQFPITTQEYFTKYENLLPFPLNMDYIELIKTTINTFKKQIQIKTLNDDKQIQLDILIAIENLRTARKFQHKIFENLMNCISEKFVDKIRFLDNKRIVLNALVLIDEIFSDYEFKSQRRWILDLLTLTLKNKFDFLCDEIMEISGIILNKFAKSIAYPETFEVLTQLILYCTDEEAEVCESLFKESVANTPENNLASFNLDFTMDLFTDIPISVDNTRVEMLHRCFVLFKEKLKREQFLSFISLFSDENRNLFLAIINLKGKVFVM